MDKAKLLDGLIKFTDWESKDGNWRVTLDYENCGDVARVLDTDGDVIGECGDKDKLPGEKFLYAIEKAIKRCSIVDEKPSKLLNFALAAERYIDVNPCDPDITDQQAVAWKNYQDAKKEYYK